MVEQIKTRVLGVVAGGVCIAAAMLGWIVATHASAPFAAGSGDWPDNSLSVLGPPTTGESEKENAAHEQGANQPAHPPGLRKLTEQEINRIRYLELRGVRQKTNRPDRVRVTVPPATVEEFLHDMEGDPDFQGRRSVREFHKLTPPQKLHWIAYYKDEKYVDKVKISSDPEVFVSFRKNVLPAVERGCATPNCHTTTNENEGLRFRLFKDPKRSPATTYADFIMLNDITVNGYRMIDRSKPEESLLLMFMLPVKDVKTDLRHPGGVELKPLFRTPNAPGYRKILTWIQSLRHPAGDYRVHLYPVAEEQAESQPAEETTQPEEPPSSEGGKPPQTQPAGPKGKPTGPP